MVLPIKHADGDPNFYEMVITIDGDMVTTETGIPLMRNVNLPGVDSTGKDVRLEKMDGTPIPREIECVGVPNAEDVAFHFPFDTISATDSQFVVKWGNTNLSEPAADSTYGSEAVWAGYALVTLMNDDPTGSIADATGNGNTGSSVGSMTSGDLVDSDYGKKITFDGSDDGFSFGSGLPLTGDYTVITRMKSVSTDALDTIWSSVTTADGHRTAYLNYPNVNKIGFYAGSGSDVDALVSASSFNDNAWHTISYQLDSTTQRIFDESGIDATRTVVTGTSANQVFTLAHHPTIGGRTLLGDIEHFRVINSALSTNYLLTTDKNLNNPTATGTSPFYLADGPIQHQRRHPQYI